MSALSRVAMERRILLAIAARAAGAPDEETALDIAERVQLVHNGEPIRPSRIVELGDEIRITVAEWLGVEHELAQLRTTPLGFGRLWQSLKIRLGLS